MGIRIRIGWGAEAGPAAAPPSSVLEMVTPRASAAAITPAEHGFASLALRGQAGRSIALRGAHSLEIAADRNGKRFLVRVDGADPRALAERFAAAYAQAELRPVPAELDPAAVRSGERVLSCAFRLRAPEYLPLRLYSDLEVDDERSAQADPLLSPLSAMAALPPGWRALSQLAIGPAPRDWAAPYARLAQAAPRTPEGGAAGGGLAGPALLAPVALLAVGGWWVRARLLAGELLLGAAGAAGLAALLALAAWALARLLRRAAPPDPLLVREKIGRPGLRAGLRLSVFAPEGAPWPDVERALEGVAAAYGVYDRGGAANGLEPLPPSGRTGDLGRLALVPVLGVLNARELACLWHLPQAESDVSLVERTGARRLLPLPASVDGPCRIGVSKGVHREVAVGLPEDVLGRNGLLVASPRHGKSKLLLVLARHLMHSPGRALFLFDPHSDLARDALGLVPADRGRDVVYLDVSDAERPFGLNLLDVGLWPSRDKAVASVLAIFKREFDMAWGPRMEDVFGYALHTLFEANEVMCGLDPVHGRDRQYTILDVSDLLGLPGFREEVLGEIADPTTLRWWRGYYANLNAQQQKEFVNPVQTKVQAYARMRHARLIVGQPRSTVDPAALLRSGAIVIVDTARGEVGEDTAALVGAALINLLAQLLAAQGEHPAGERARATLLVDEFHTMRGADYEYVLSELPKFGANTWLATQSLGRLAALDRASGRGLVSILAASFDQLFVFHVSPEDARTLAPALGEPISEGDVDQLHPYECYVRLLAGGRRRPAFWVALDPPPEPSPERTEALAAASRRWCGRARGSVELGLRSARARVDRACESYGKRERGGDWGGSSKRRDRRDRPAAERATAAAAEPTTGGGRVPWEAPPSEPRPGDGALHGDPRAGEPEYGGGEPADGGEGEAGGYGVEAGPYVPPGGVSDSWSGDADPEAPA